MSALDLFVGWKLRAILAAGVIAALALFIIWGRADAVKAERARMAPVIAGYQARIDALLGQITDLEGKLKLSNDRVDQMKADADAREKAAAVQLKAAQKRADKFRLRAAEIAAAKPTGDECVAARDLIVETLKDERQ